MSGIKPGSSHLNSKAFCQPSHLPVPWKHLLYVCLFQESLCLRTQKRPSCMPGKAPWMVLGSQSTEVPPVFMLPCFSWEMAVLQHFRAGRGGGWIGYNFGPRTCKTWFSSQLHHWLVVWCHSSRSTFLSPKALALTGVATGAWGGGVSSEICPYCRSCRLPLWPTPRETARLLQDESSHQSLDAISPS